MEVHPPEHPIHTWRDFLIHIATIVVGLLIAIALEQSVEWLHHRHAVREARENITHELEENHDAATKDLVFIGKDIDRIKANIQTIHKLQKQPKDFQGSLTYTMEFNSLDSSAWATSRDTGALTLMPYKQVQDYSDIYEEQKVVNDEAVSVFQRETQAMAPIFTVDKVDEIPPAELQIMLHETAGTLISLQTLLQLVQQLDTHYKTALAH